MKSILWKLKTLYELISSKSMTRNSLNRDCQASYVLIGNYYQQYSLDLCDEVDVKCHELENVMNIVF